MITIHFPTSGCRLLFAALTFQSRKWLAARRRSGGRKSTTCLVHFPEGRSSTAASLGTPTAAALRGSRNRKEKKKKTERNPFFLLGKNFIKCERRGRTLHKPLMYFFFFLSVSQSAGEPHAQDAAQQRAAFQKKTTLHTFICAMDSKISHMHSLHRPTPPRVARRHGCKHLCVSPAALVFVYYIFIILG